MIDPWKKEEPQSSVEQQWLTRKPVIDDLPPPTGFTSRLRATNEFFYTLLFNFKMGLGLLLFVPMDAGMLTRFGPLHRDRYSFFFWLTLILLGIIASWRQLPRLRRQTIQAKFGEAAYENQPFDKSDLLAATCAILGGVFLMLLPGLDSKHSVGTNWEWGFRIGGALLFAKGIWGHYRLAIPLLPDRVE